MDEPGMGKSTKLVRLAKEMKDNNGSKWIIFVKLTSYRKQLESSELKNGLSFLNEVENLKPTNFKKKILEYCIQKDRVVLFLDGLDEILPKYKDRVIQLLNLTQNTWITTRECSSIEKSLKNNFVCYRLEPLTPNQQKDFLMKYFEKLSPDLKATRIENLSKEILNKTKDIGESFASNILHLKMLAEIYLSEGKLNLFQLYQKFAEKKYDIYFEEKIKLDQSGVINFDYLKRLAIIQLEKAHRRLAVSILFPEWGRRLLNSEEVITFEDKKLESFEKQELQRVGFMRYVDNDISSFNFIHHTYAEYFIANFLSDVLLKKRSIPRSKRYALIIIQKDNESALLLFCQLRDLASPENKKVNRLSE
ncbi:unnamed protein product [Ceutorhynchus assimilis]|uniref:NACHT domain-containing protein n=1 Tax=Ceutorhynchus assimilis TaxID=467358 RepID=A0A9N9MJ89_9CUCU|nr:unnamed protein product [Ceutorhynchus assimilis]